MKRTTQRQLIEIKNNSSFNIENVTRLTIHKVSCSGKGRFGIYITACESPTIENTVFNKPIHIWVSGENIQTFDRTFSILYLYKKDGVAFSVDSEVGQQFLEQGHKPVNGYIYFKYDKNKEANEIQVYGSPESDPEAVITLEVSKI